MLKNLNPNIDDGIRGMKNIGGNPEKGPVPKPILDFADHEYPVTAN